MPSPHHLSLDQLKAREHQAWQTYAATCFHPFQTPEQRAEHFRRAMVALIEVQKRERAMLAEAQLRERMASS